MQKLTLDYIKSLIVNAEYQHFGDTLTVCVLTLKNGFTVTGESACINKADFNADIGQQVAYDNAVDKIWQLEGYLAVQRSFEAGATRRLSDETAKLIREEILDIPSTPVITGLFITPEGYHLVTDKDYGEGFFIPLRNGRFVYAKKGQNQPIGGLFTYVPDPGELTKNEVEHIPEGQFLTTENLHWNPDNFIYFWNAGALVGLDVALQGLFAQQAEYFERLAGKKQGLAPFVID